MWRRGRRSATPAGPVRPCRAGCRTLASPPALFVSLCHPPLPPPWLAMPTPASVAAGKRPPPSGRHRRPRQRCALLPTTAPIDRLALRGHPGGSASPGSRPRPGHVPAWVTSRPGHVPPGSRPHLGHIPAGHVPPGSRPCLNHVPALVTYPPGPRPRLGHIPAEVTPLPRSRLRLGHIPAWVTSRLGHVPAWVTEGQREHPQLYSIAPIDVLAKTPSMRPPARPVTVSPRPLAAAHLQRPAQGPAKLGPASPPPGKGVAAGRGRGQTRTSRSTSVGGGGGDGGGGGGRRETRSAPRAIRAQRSGLHGPRSTAPASPACPLCRPNLPSAGRF